MGRIICIANRKGGVGKTTTAINLSAALGVAGEGSLLVDCDPQGNATSGVGVKLEADTLTVYDVLLGACQVEEAVQKTAIAHLDVLPANHDLIGAEVELLNLEHREYRLRTLLHHEREQYHYVLLDCPPSLGLLTVNALTAADSVLIPLQCEYYALEGLRSLLETITLIRERLNPELAIEGLLLTMFDPRNKLCHQVAEEVRRFFPHQVFDTVIPRNVRLSESPSHGLPVVLYDPSCRGAQSYTELAREITNSEPATWVTQPRRENAEEEGGVE
ncbi:MAG TPA: AAA family ATPase [Candidatus Binatia bacterium]|nr:AAA family ATPase [Candidatus Binatia bacterium]